MPCSRCRSRSSSSTSPCTVTSSAVVGSSAISTSGCSASAMAIITRWRMPPESSCGYCFSRLSASEMRTAFSASTRALARLAARQAGMRLDRLDQLPADRQHRVERGHRLLEDHGDAVAADAPHRAFAKRWRGRCRRAGCGRDEMRAAGCGSSRMIASAVIDLPEPDSPAMHSVSPRASVKERSETTGALAVLAAHRNVEAGDVEHRAFRDSRRPGPTAPDLVALLPSFEDAAREVERHHPVRHVDDLADPQIAADRSEHVGVDRVHAVARGQAGRSSARPRFWRPSIRSGPMPVVTS